ncbi:MULTISPECIES: hypothetical protein [unclassified Colwellia]|jgi:hypothetical protein|uniref:hypothetical protein n=1 Tax=unclassified Colwellia TaxID=196834 RepID=UPI0015F39081|nr:MULTISPECIES: hypothetical protein [unclassified Colwellia]MBA6231065.1 hypothetical protein [Colwellia sp. MB02u-7]MBA6235830.1 hypothetical protein [Colwellia sp. MB02u-11]MBA6254418.1 hypothetical protein [Colwellia sp. MB3u-28]MBA6258673.1 hypothetical protein [Colwellia sp. MB3u-41]MBA6298781.1 hypothetical protein [Colwellia sp. MB3u-22]
MKALTFLALFFCSYVYSCESGEPAIQLVPFAQIEEHQNSILNSISVFVPSKIGKLNATDIYVQVEDKLVIELPSLVSTGYDGLSASRLTLNNYLASKASIVVYYRSAPGVMCGPIKTYKLATMLTTKAPIIKHLSPPS